MSKRAILKELISNILFEKIIYCFPMRTQLGIYGQIYPFEVVYLTVFPESSPNTDSISFYQSLGQLLPH